MRRALLVLAVLLASGGAARAADLMPVFDAHLHYSHDAWDLLPPDKALALLRQAGLRRALVSSSGDTGQQKLAQLAPELILPSLRPYRQRGDQSTWVRDDSVKAYLEAQLAQRRYVALGEYHIYGADADLSRWKRDCVAVFTPRFIPARGETVIYGSQRCRWVLQ